MQAMKKVEDRCVDCGLPCLGDTCPYRNVTVHYCDLCGSEGAEYKAGNLELCEDCAEMRVQELFNELTLPEKAKAVELDLEDIND